VVAGRPGLRVPGLNRVPLLIFALLAALAGSAAAQSTLDLHTAFTQLESHGLAATQLEPDARSVPWTMLRRLALLGAEFLPPHRPISRGEITGIATRAHHSQGPGLGLAAERRQLAWLLSRYGSRTHAVNWSSCDCRTPQVHVGLDGAVSLIQFGPGELVSQQSGLASRGIGVLTELDLTVCSGPFWLGATPRHEWPIWQGSTSVNLALRYTGWPEPTGRPALGRTRTQAVNRIAWPRVAAGVAMGNWSLAAGLMPVSVGAGLEGDGLTLGMTSESVPQVVLRRTRPLQWSGFMGWFDPEHVLFRLGITSEQTITYGTPRGRESHRANPVLTQWLFTWDHTPWWRTTVCGTALSAARRGQSLWPDLMQINLPMLDATWTEVDYGPVTDRMVSLIMEARWRRAPWPVLPSAAGRVWWEYAGEDFRPHDQLPILPEISAPASLAGVELVDHRWDLGAQYLLTRHARVLWYGNGGFSEGYSHGGALLGHELGGGAEAWTGVVRWRTASGRHELELRGRTAFWREGNRVPVDTHRRELDLTWRHLAAGHTWTAVAGWVTEEVGEISERWWRAQLTRAF